MKSIREILRVFQASDSAIRPHFVLTGTSGSGKTFLIEGYCKELGIDLIPVNAAALTKEGVSGSSLSRVLTPLKNTGGKPVAVLVDEFDKLFISGSAEATTHTSAVQDEFLKCLEGTATIAGEYGAFAAASTSNVLWIFAGAFGGQEVDSAEKLRQFGIRNEFIGRVPLVYHLECVPLDKLLRILEASEVLDSYLSVYPNIKRKTALQDIGERITADYPSNTIGARMVTMLIHMYFIDGFPAVQTVNHNPKIVH